MSGFNAVKQEENKVDDADEKPIEVTPEVVVATPTTSGGIGG